MFGLEVWELVMIATGAFWGAWFMRRRTKKIEEERKLEEERNRKQKRR
jgi:hypothetical protein